MMIVESLYFWITFIILLGLISIYWIIPTIENPEGLAVKRLNSITSGITISFLCLYAIPNLYPIFEQIVKNIANVPPGIKNYIGHLISLFFLVGFSLHYISEKLSQKQTYGSVDEEQEESNYFQLFPFYFNMAIWMLFHFCIMVILPSMITSSLIFTGFFMFIIALHFFLSRHVLGGYFRGAYQYVSRKLMSIALLIGWGIGLVIMPQQKPFIMILIGAFIAGMLLMSVIKTEFDSKNPSNTSIFLSSTLLSGIIILLIVALESNILGRVI